MARMFLVWLFANSSFSVDRNSKMAATARRSQNIGPYWKMKKNCRYYKYIEPKRYILNSHFFKFFVWNLKSTLADM